MKPGCADRLADLHSRVHRGAYRAQPSRRVYIPKADGRQRPLGIAALEDKIVQQAAGIILNAIYENDFLGFSYGFRPKRNQHQALDALTVGITRKRVNWVLDMDIRGFFDNMSHEWTMKFVEHRVGVVCVSSARTDLCGGCRVTDIPTATLHFADLGGSILTSLLMLNN
jgi:RNA-directed DNA polymerase